MKQSFLVVLLISVMALPVQAVNYWDQIDLLKKYNHDDQKYDFTKYYLKSLRELKKAHYDLTLNQEVDINNLGLFLTQLKKQNVSFRVAKNYIDRFYSPDTNNGLILSVVNDYVEICNQQIDINEKLQNIVENHLEMPNHPKLNEITQQNFYNNLKRLYRERKYSLLKLIDNSHVIRQILVSNQPDRYGELVRLGITDDERDKLVKLIEEMQIPDYDNLELEVQEGDSIIDVSVSLIRDLLNDQNWKSLDI